jgi:hypothetical protein
MTVKGITVLGKFTFFMMETLFKKAKGELLNELENHCQGKSPAMRKRV